MPRISVIAVASLRRASRFGGSRAVQLRENGLPLSRRNPPPVDFRAALHTQPLIVGAAQWAASGTPMRGQIVGSPVAQQIKNGANHLRIIGQVAVQFGDEV